MSKAMCMTNILYHLLIITDGFEDYKSVHMKLTEFHRNLPAKRSAGELLINNFFLDAEESKSFSYKKL